MKVGNCPVCANAYPHPESEGPAVVTLSRYPGSVGCVSCLRSWPENWFPALSVSTSPNEVSRSD